MRLVTANEMREIDRHAIEKIGIPSLVLMENAGLKILFTLEKNLSGLRGKRFTIVCGRGNNGGDGLVVARHLLNAGVSVEVFLTSRMDELSPDATKNLTVFMASGGQPVVMADAEDLDRLRVTLNFSDVVVDAIFGTGFTGNINGYLREVVRTINQSHVWCVAVDVPSGLDATTGRVSDPSIRASSTITLGAPKLGMFVYPGRDIVGEVWVADIGLPQISFETVSASHTLVTHELASALLPARRESAHKNAFGHLLILGGSDAYQGAGVLAAQSGLRSGAGLVTLGLPASIARQMTCPVPPEVIVRPFDDRDGGFALEAEEIRGFVGRYAAVVAGPGWGRSESSKASMNALTDAWAGGIVLDADALPEPADLAKLKKHGHDMVLTPHVGEMARMTGRTITSIQEDMIGVAREFAGLMSCVLVLKSATTIIAAPDGRVYVCSRPNSGLARGGAGDVLSGLIGGLMAQGLSALHAAIVGVYLHSDAADVARGEFGADAMSVSDVVAALPKSFRRLRGEEKHGDS
ncbi:MAG TPA: NAD(P)H-hydrate dehydratase [Candidatus Ozemobacteraceae bacterium]|nr:NAD(P)H-hydrate dehydratase [Candidatus Ozemobacteraceae bacterium]